MDIDRIRGLGQEAARLEAEATVIAGELEQLDARRNELRRRYEAALEEMRRILAATAEAASSANGEWPDGGCAWCGEPLRPRTIAKGEVCPECVARYGFDRVDHLPRLSAEEADSLPYGLIQVDRAGTVVGYNRAEEAESGRRRDRVIGRNFFRDVAPCTAVREFEGRFREMVARGEAAREAFRYVFRLKERERLVGISLRFDPVLETGVIAVVPLDEARAA